MGSRSSESLNRARKTYTLEHHGVDLKASCFGRRWDEGGVMRIIGGVWRGRRLAAPHGARTRPTADRVRQALFDILLHAPWAGHEAIEGTRVLDVFAGTGALGLEALSRGAGHASFIENDPAALAALGANIASCEANDRCTIIPTDALSARPGGPCGLVFLDPPYQQSLLKGTVQRLRIGGWIAPGTLIITETQRPEPPALPALLLAERTHGAACLSFWRAE